jgi:uncharacterized repeat protein (TIGR01451 family)
MLFTLMMGRHVPPKRRFLQEPHGVTSQKTAFFIITAVNTSNLTLKNVVFWDVTPFGSRNVAR